MPQLEPESPETQPAAPGSGPVQVSLNGHGGKAPPHRWYHKVASVTAAIFCFELGVFLLVFPWIDDWSVNYLRYLPAWMHGLWLSPYFRGAVSGIGLLNIYISFVEVFRLRRFSS